MSDVDTVECAICAAYGITTRIPETDATEIDHDPRRDSVEQRIVYACPACAAQGEPPTN